MADSARDPGRTSAEEKARILRLAQLGLVVALAFSLGLVYLLSEAFQEEAGRAVAILSQGDASLLQEYILSFGNWAPAISLSLMILQALVAPLPSLVLSFANGLAFGAVWGCLLSVAGHVLAAAVCFWISRAIGRGPAEALAGRTRFLPVDRWFARRGAYAIFLARLVPGISFDAVSFAAGVLRIGFGKFIAATALGTLPQTFLYAYLGQNAPQYIWPFLAVSVLAVAGVLAVSIVAQRRARHGESASEPSAQSCSREHSEKSRLPMAHGQRLNVVHRHEVEIREPGADQRMIVGAIPPPPGQMEHVLDLDARL